MTIPISMEILNARELEQGMQQFSQNISGAALKQIYKTAQEIVRRMKEYPSPPPFSSYSRTGTLGRGWKVTPYKNGVSISVSVPYASRVVGNIQGLEQAWMHVGRWQKFKDISDNEIKKLSSEMNNEIVNAGRKALSSFPDINEEVR